MLNVVRFKNDPCVSTTATSSTNSNTNKRTGSCLSASECTDKAGTKAGTCASGYMYLCLSVRPSVSYCPFFVFPLRFGVCCVFTVDSCSSSGKITQNNTYIRNEGFPTGIKEGPTMCSFTLGKASAGKVLASYLLPYIYLY